MILHEMAKNNPSQKAGKEGPDEKEGQE